MKIGCLEQSDGNKPYRPGNQKTFEDVQKEIELIEFETNKRIIEILNSCEEEVTIRVLDNAFTRNERENAYPIQIDAMSIAKMFPNGMSASLRELNKVFGNQSNSSTLRTVKKNTAKKPYFTLSIRAANSVFETNEIAVSIFFNTPLGNIGYKITVGVLQQIVQDFFVANISEKIEITSD